MPVFRRNPVVCNIIQQNTCHMSFLFLTGGASERYGVFSVKCERLFVYKRSLLGVPSILIRQEICYELARSAAVKDSPRCLASFDIKIR